MPAGRPAKSKRGKVSTELQAEDLDPKLSKRARALKVMKIYKEKKKEENNNDKTEGNNLTSDEEDTESEEEEKNKREGKRKKQKVGRPSLKERAMTETELKEKRKELNKAKRQEEAEDKKRLDLEEKKRKAVNKRWDKEREKKKVHGLLRCREEVRGLLPGGLHQELDLLSMVAAWRPECPVLSTSQGLSGREGKTQQYERLAQLKACLSSCPLADRVILTWASDLANIDYNQFLACGLTFRDPKDIPRLVVMQQAATRIREEVWGNSRREDVRRQKLDHAIRVFKVGAK